MIITFIICLLYTFIKYIYIYIYKFFLLHNYIIISHSLVIVYYNLYYYIIVYIIIIIIVCKFFRRFSIKHEIFLWRGTWAINLWTSIAYQDNKTIRIIFIIILRLFLITVRLTTGI